MNVRSQILKALFYGIKTGLCPKQGKMWGPDMRGDIDTLLTDLQHYFQKIMAGQPQNRTSV